MDIFFQDPAETPLPPEQVRIRALRAEPWPDGRRVRVYFEVDPSLKRPSAEVKITAADGEDVAEAHIIESMSRKMELTMHLRQPEPGGQYHLSAILFFTPPLPKPEGTGPAPIPAELPEPQVVDRAEIVFEVASPSG